MGELGDADGEALDAFGEVVGGRLTLQRGVHGEHHLVDAPRLHAADQRVDRQVLGTDAFERR